MKRVILALDELRIDQCLDLVSKVGDLVYAVKIHNWFDRQGPAIVQRLRSAGARRIWVDAKLHDTPNAVRLRAKAIAESGANIISVHASGEIEMMAAAVETGPAEVYAVTALTSLSEEQARLMYGQPLKAAVLHMARLAKLAGAHGVICSPNEVGFLSKMPGLQGMKFITPGVSSPNKAFWDQKRANTPARAVASGSTYIVIGRQVTQAPDPLKAFREVEKEIFLSSRQSIGVA